MGKSRMLAERRCSNHIFSICQFQHVKLTTSLQGTVPIILDYYQNCDFPKGTSGSIYGTLGRGSLKGLLKFLEGKKFHTCGLLSTYFLTSKCHIQPEFDDGAPLNLQTHSTHQITYLSLIWVTKPEYGNRQAHSSWFCFWSQCTLLLSHLLNIQLAVNFNSKPEYIIIGPFGLKTETLFCVPSHSIFGHELSPILCSWYSQATLCEPMVDSTGTIHNLEVGDPLPNSTKYANPSLIN
jgi:hypothetical protein